MKIGAPVAPAQEAAPCLAALLDDWILAENRVLSDHHHPTLEDNLEQ